MFDCLKIYHLNRGLRKKRMGIGKIGFYWGKMGKTEKIAFFYNACLKRLPQIRAANFIRQQIRLYKKSVASCHTNTSTKNNSVVKNLMQNR